MGDMIEYGFESKTGSCGHKYCIDKQQFKEFDSMMKKSEVFGQRLKDSTITAYRRASCHPEFKKNVTPKVEFIWQLFPLNVFFYNPVTIWCTLPVDIFSVLCCWCFWIPFQILVVMPWNTMFAILIAFILIVFAAAAFVFAILTSSSLGVLSFAWIGIQGVIALLIAFLGFFVLFFTTGGFAVGGIVTFGPVAFFLTVLGAFISTLGF